MATEITRTGAAALIPEPIVAQIFQGMVPKSAALSRMASISMGTKQERMPVLSALPTAYFVSGDTGYRKATAMAWENKTLIAEILSCIVPVPKVVLSDAQFDIWGNVRPRIEGAMALALDNAVFFGNGKPSTWPDDISTAAAAAGNTIIRTKSSVAKGGIAQDMNELMGKVEAIGYDCSGFVTSKQFRQYLRGARDANGQRLLDVNENSYEGNPISYGMPGLFDRTTAGAVEMFAADWSQFILGVRQDMNYTLLDQAVIQDPATGDILYNLAQQGMIALMVEARFAFQVANPITYEEADAALRYPGAILTKPVAAP